MRRPRSYPLTTTLLALGLATAGCGSSASPVAQERPAAPSTGVAAPGPSSTPRPAQSDSPAPAEDEPDTPRTTVAAYFVGDTPSGPRLFREFRSVTGQDPLTAAARLLTEGDAADPDYRTLFPRGTFSSVTTSDGLLLVELPDATWTERPAGMSGREAQLAVQQLVHTLQAAQQARVPVTALLDGRPASLFGIDTSQGVTNADPLEVLALVNITAPEEGATVSGTLKTSGVASSPEANVPWELRRGAETVLSGFATAEGWMDKLHPWEAEIDLSGLEPGAYTFVARTDDQSGGEGEGPTEDTKEITVR